MTTTEISLFGNLPMGIVNLPPAVRTNPFIFGLVMNKLSRLIPALFLASFSSLPAASYFEVFPLSEAAATPGTGLGAETSFLDSVVGNGSTAYGLIRINGGGAIVEYDGTSGAFSTLTSNTDWTSTGSGTLGGFYGANLSGSNLVFSNTFDNQIYSVDTTSGSVAVLTTSGAFDAATGGSANLTASSFFTTAGNGFVYDGSTDSILGVDAAGNVSTAVTSLQLATLMGSDSVNGLGVAGDTLFIGNNSSDTLWAWDLVSGTGSVGLSTAVIEGVTDDVDGRVGFAAFHLGADGRKYFYENDSDYLLSFDPADPSGTLRRELTEAQLNDGPAGNDRAGNLTTFEGELAWSGLRDGFYAVPEPSISLLSGLATLSLLLRRQRA